MTLVGVGIDIVELGELAGVLDRPHMARRMFTREEREYCRGKVRPLDHFAARFAAKEAAFKALGIGWTGQIRWHDAVVVAASGAAPELVVRGALARRARRLGATGFHLSLTHSGTYAVAVVIASS